MPFCILLLPRCSPLVLPLFTFNHTFLHNHLCKSAHNYPEICIDTTFCVLVLALPQVYHLYIHPTRPHTRARTRAHARSTLPRRGDHGMLQNVSFSNNMLAALEGWGAGAHLCRVVRRHVLPSGPALLGSKG